MSSLELSYETSCSIWGQLHSPVDVLVEVIVVSRQVVAEAAGPVERVALKKMAPVKLGQLENFQQTKET